MAILRGDMVPPDDNTPKDELELISEQTILTTKLYRPPVTPDLIRRERLLEYLERNRLRPLTLISAPAGYGKSVLARMWLEASDCPTAWISLDEADDDPVTFLSYLLAAISATFPSLQIKTQTLLNAPQTPGAAVVARYLLNDLGQMETPFILALDDLHTVKDQAIYDLLTELLRHPSPVMHLVLISRQDPPLPIASLRARREVTEIRAQSLRFTPQETAQLLRQTLQREVDEDLAGRWTEKTEGWVTALRLAALSLRQIGQHQELHTNISSGSHYLQEYLLAEILAGLPPDNQDRLLKISILDRFCAGLVEAVSGQGDRFFHWLENSNLFLIPLDQGHCWYRFHHLFQQMLQNLLHSQLSEQAIADLYQRASRWFAENGLVDEAIRYALTAGDTQVAVDLVIQHRYDLMNTEQWHRLDRWLKLLPDTVAQNPLLLSTKAYIAISHDAEASEVLSLIMRAEQLLASLTLGTVEYEALQGEIDVIRALYDLVTGSPIQANNRARGSLKLLPREALYTRTFAIGELAAGLQMLGDMKQAVELVTSELVDHAWPEGLRIRTLQYLCMAFFHEGDLFSVIAHTRGCTESTDNSTSQETVSYCRYHLGIAYYLRNEVTQAKPVLQALLDARETSSPLYLAQGGFALALIYEAQDRTADASLVVNVLEDQFRKGGNTIALAYTEAFRVELALRHGNTVEARLLSQRIEFDPGLPMWWFYEPFLTAIKLLYAERTEESLDEARARLQVLDQQMAELHRNNVRIHVLALAALVLDALGDEPAALEQLRAALDLGEPGGFIRTFVDLGPPMASLLNRLKNQTLKEAKKKLPTAGFAYLTRILAAFAEDDHSKNKAVSSPVRTDSQAIEIAMIYPLTQRELKVIKLLGTDLPPNEIASELVISLSTVRTHLKSIYSKLDVHNRAEAVRRARDLGLI